MNKEYTYLDGKIVVRDELGNKNLVEYSAKIDEILVQENLIETMEMELKTLQLQKENYKENKTLKYLRWLPVVVAIVVPPIMAHLFLGQTYYVMTETLTGVVKVGPVASLIISAGLLPLASMLTIGSYLQSKNNEKKQKGIFSAIEFLNKQLEQEKEKLEKLKQSKKVEQMQVVESKENFKVVSVNDKHALKTFRQFLHLYYDCGYNDKKYYQYYQDGKLVQELRKIYSDVDIEKIEEYLKEKEPQLVKKE